jgi:hypothetical protein
MTTAEQDVKSVIHAPTGWEYKLVAIPSYGALKLSTGLLMNQHAETSKSV